MAAIKFIKRTVALDGSSISETLPASFFNSEASAHTFIIAGVRDGSPVTFTGSVSATFNNRNDTDVMLIGSIVDGAAVVTLSNPCYALTGRFTLTIDVNGATVYECNSRIKRRSSSIAYDPNNEVSVAALSAEIAEMRTATAAANTAAAAADTARANMQGVIGVEFSANAAYSAGDYVWYNGDLYRFTADHAAGAWAGTDAENAVVGTDLSSIKSALNDVNSGKIAYGTSGYKEVGTLTVTQKNNTIILNGTGSATATQLNTKIAITPPFNAWNATSTPSQNLIYPLNLVSGHCYKLTATVVSGNRSAGGGTGAIQFRFVDDDEVALETARLEATDTSVACQIVSDGSSVRLVVLVARLIVASDLTIRVDVEDITLYKKQDILTFDTEPTQGSANPVTSDGVFSAVNVVETAGAKASLLVDEMMDSIGMHDEAALTKTVQDGYYWNAEGSTAVLTQYANWTADTVAATPGDSVHVRIRGQTSTRQYPVLVVDDDLNIIEHYGAREQKLQDIYFTVPAGATKILLTHYTSSSTTAQVYPYLLNSVTGMIAAIDTTASYQGCKLSLLGDSFSAFNGYSAGNHYYYPASGTDVNDVNQMWWKIVADYFGMTPLVIGAWSGSPVADGVRSGYTPASDPARCEALDDGTNVPDVVFIAMGVNDYSYTENASQFGTWDGTTALGNASDLSDYDNTTFKTAYATMLARIQKKYPDAFIICITPWFQKRRSSDTGANYLNAIGKSISDYADAVRDVCRIMHVACIDGTDIGFNRRNYYPTYCQDAAGQSTHPNIAGQAQIAKAIIAQLKTLHRLGA